jgi:hypothetical protein
MFDLRQFVERNKFHQFLLIESLDKLSSDQIGALQGAIPVTTKMEFLCINLCHFSKAKDGSQSLIAIKK